ncbi:hypothetical protein P167DRAFT_538918 [Morchella conica CCBAS932]|uniref:Azaphilone pigments biosynthesis cluster protein L N-terminal domain-containing protein n=1 Tax=Morchella conica CCBAS932 TaxID=1392247 RepID=A0A3N4KT53_9PEZI|nr:hypothetical protein P167DRAFT_538918 [Morchella conica CCBAS932]
MAELLGTAASVIAVIQLTAAVASLSYEYISGVARAPSELQRFMNELKALTAVLSRLQMFALDNPDIADSWGLGEELRRCAEELKDVKERLEPKRGWWGTALGRLQWPLGGRETLDYVWKIERLKSHFTLAMTAENRTFSKVIDKNVQDIKRDLYSHTSEMKTQQLSSLPRIL